MSPYTLQVEEELSEDLHVRVVLYGWDQVQRSGPLSPLFAKLRRINELQFSDCHQVERLAILTIMHMLLRFHINPSHGNGRDVPQWYLEAYVISSSRGNLSILDIDKQLGHLIFFYRLMPSNSLCGESFFLFEIFTMRCTANSLSPGPGFATSSFIHSIGTVPIDFGNCLLMVSA